MRSMLAMAICRGWRRDNREMRRIGCWKRRAARHRLTEDPCQRALSSAVDTEPGTSSVPMAGSFFSPNAASQKTGLEEAHVARNHVAGKSHRRPVSPGRIVTHDFIDMPEQADRRADVSHQGHHPGELRRQHDERELRTRRHAPPFNRSRCLVPFSMDRFSVVMNR